MRTKSLPSLPGFIFCIYILAGIGCTATRNSYKIKDEDTDIKVKEKPDEISLASLREQMAPNFTDRASASRGILLDGATSLATTAIKKLIARNRAKFTADYSFALTDLYFYDHLSTESVFDPMGMQFNGFTMVRTFVNRQQQTDTALIARFELDTSDPSEIINNSIFRLRVKSVDIRYAKAKLTRFQKNLINMDIEITFKTSYVNEDGQLFDNVDIGKFYLVLRDAPIDKNSPAYAHFNDSLNGTRINGKSFIVPRSFGYYKTVEGTVEKSYSQGAYSIAVKVTESSRHKFVTKVLVDNSGKLIDMLGRQTKRRFEH